jgi:hypothetical protein
MADPTSLDLIAAQLAARGYYVHLRYERYLTSPTGNRWAWVAEIENDTLGQIPRGVGESAVLAVERARQSLGLIEKARRETE